MNKEEIKKELHKKSKEELIKYLLEDVNTIQYLEQKESILDKVTDKLKQLKTDLKEHEKKYEHKKDISTGLIGVRINAILKIIEGENHE